MGQMVKNLSSMWETCVWSLGQEDPLEKEMTTHSSIPAWKIPWTEESGGLQSMGLQKVGHDWVTKQEVRDLQDFLDNNHNMACMISLSFFNVKWSHPKKLVFNQFD